MKKDLSSAARQLGAEGGKANFKKGGRERMSRMGKISTQKTKRDYSGMGKLGAAKRWGKKPDQAPEEPQT